MSIKEKKKKKWGEGIKLNNCWTQKELNFISRFARLNVLFNPLNDISSYELIFKNVKGDRLLNFYNEFNGCKLFSDSLCIYGIQNNLSDDVYQTYDLNWENNRIYQMLHLNEYLFFGSLGGQYLFAYKINSNNEIVYCINVDTGEIVHTFKNFDLLFSTLFNKLYDEYDKTGEKIHKNKEFRKIKSLYNKTTQIEYLEE